MTFKSLVSDILLNTPKTPEKAQNKLPQAMVDSFSTITGKLQTDAATKSSLSLREQILEKNIQSQEDFDAFMTEKRHENRAQLLASPQLRQEYKKLERHWRSDQLKKEYSNRTNEEHKYALLYEKGRQLGKSEKDLQALIPQNVLDSDNFQRFLEQSKQREPLNQALIDIGTLKSESIKSIEQLINESTNTLLSDGDLAIANKDKLEKQLDDRINKYSDIFTPKEMDEIKKKTAEVLNTEIAKNISDPKTQKAFAEQNKQHIQPNAYRQILQTAEKKEQLLNKPAKELNLEKEYKKISEGNLTPTGNVEVDSLITEVVDTGILNMSPENAQKVQNSHPLFGDFKLTYIQNYKAKAKKDSVALIEQKLGRFDPSLSRIIDFDSPDLSKQLDDRITMMDKGRLVLAGYEANDPTAALSFYKQKEIDSALTAFPNKDPGEIVDIAELIMSKTSYMGVRSDHEKIFNRDELFIGENRQYLQNPDIFKKTQRSRPDENLMEGTITRKIKDKYQNKFGEIVNNQFFKNLSSAVAAQLSVEDSDDAEVKVERFMNENFKIARYNNAYFLTENTNKQSVADNLSTQIRQYVKSDNTYVLLANGKMMRLEVDANMMQTNQISFGSASLNFKGNTVGLFGDTLRTKNYELHRKLGSTRYQLYERLNDDNLPRRNAETEFDPGQEEYSPIVITPTP